MKILLKYGGELTGVQRIRIDYVGNSMYVGNGVEIAGGSLYIDDLFIVPIEDVYTIEEEGE